MQNKKQKKNYLGTSKGVTPLVSGIPFELEDDLDSFKDRILSNRTKLGLTTKDLESEEESEEEYKKANEPFSSWKPNLEEPKVEEKQSGLDIDIKDKISYNLSELLKDKEKIIKGLRYEISQKNIKIDDLQTTQKLRLEKTIQENTLEIKRLKELIYEFQEIIRLPSLTQKDIEKSLSIFITDEED